jgi:hypothetical protein
MSHKLLPRLGSAIASTILSYAALSLVGADKAQAAFLTYNFQVEQDGGSGFFKFSDSSLTGIGYEEIAVGEGKFNTPIRIYTNDYDLAGAIALFFQGNFRGLQAWGGEQGETEETLGGGEYLKVSGRAAWYIRTEEASSLGTWASYFSGGRDAIYMTSEGAYFSTIRVINDTPVTYTLVNTEPEPGDERVPEPLTAGGTALALAGLSWLKHKKKMAA